MRRNLYAQGVWRKFRVNELERVKQLEEKHKRGDAARKARAERRLED